MSEKAKPMATGTASELDALAQADYKEFCLWVGHVLSQWSILESELAFLYAVALRTPMLLPAVESFYAAQSFETKLQQTGAVLKVELRDNPELLAKWQNLVNRLSKLQKRRNQIAHGRTFATIINRDEKSEYYGVHLVPYYGQLRANQSNDISKVRIEKIKRYEPIDLGQLHEIIEKIGQAAESVGHFMHDVTEFIRGKKKPAS